MTAYNFDIDPKQQVKIFLNGLLAGTSPSHDRPDYDEYIASIAEGGADRLSPQKRSEVLDYISRNPEAARLLKSVSEAKEAPGFAVTGGGDRHLFIIGGAFWAVAAVLLLSLVLWKAAEPQLMTRNPDGTVTAYSLEQQEQYWNQLEQQRQGFSGFTSDWRNVAIMVLVFVVGILTVLLAVRLAVHNRGSYKDTEPQRPKE